MKPRLTATLDLMLMLPMAILSALWGILVFGALTPFCIVGYFLQPAEARKEIGEWLKQRVKAAMSGHR